MQELISVGFAVEFILEHLREIARAFFMRKVHPAIEAIDVRIGLIWRVAASIFFPALVDPVALGIKVSFLDFTDDSTVSFPFLCFSIYVIQNTFIFPAVVAWLVFATL